MKLILAVMMISLTSFACSGQNKGSAGPTEGSAPGSTSDYGGSDEIPVPIPPWIETTRDSGVKPSTSTDPDITKIPAPMTMDPALPCPENSDVTISRAISKSFSMSGKVQSLSFELSLNDCHGKLLPMTGQKITIDFVAPMAYEHMLYEMQNSQDFTVLASGNMKAAFGFDIFGKATPKYMLFQTSAWTFPKAHEKIILVVKLGRFYVPSSYPDGMETFLRVGSSKPFNLRLPLVP